MQFVRCPDGARLALELADGDAPPVVCLPGGPGRAAAYLEDLGGLGRTRRLALVDLRGSGRSPFPDDPASLAMDRQAADVEAVRVHLGLDRLTLLAHSAGSLVAQLYAAAHPDRVGALVLVTPSGRLQGVDRPDVAAIRATRSGEAWYADAAAAEEAARDAPAAMQGELEKAQRPFFYGRWDERTQAHAGTADRQMSPRAALGFRPGPDFDPAAVLDALREVSAPTLVVAGTRDGLTGVAAAEAVAASFPASRLITLPGAGHFPWVDEPAAFREAVEEFLRSVHKPPAAG